MMLDLHIHSNWSDGVLSPHEIIAKWVDFRAVSITDHNSLRGILSLQHDSGTLPIVLPGFETRLMGEPDYLFYLPTNDLVKIKAAEEDLVKIRQGDHLVSRYIYETHYRLPNFEQELAKVCVSGGLAECLCTSRELAYMIVNCSAMDGLEFCKALRDVRKWKTKYMKLAWAGKLPAMKEAADYAAPHYSNPPEWLSRFAQRHSAVVALAHPWREVKRNFLRDPPGSSKIEMNEAVKWLENLAKRFISTFPGGAMECSHFDGIHKHFNVDPNVLTDTILSIARTLSLPVVTGSDTHTAGSENFLPRGCDWEGLCKLLPAKIRCWLEANSG